ncbi:hypothetical protein FRC12_020414, partial [Ceratobasidium sp. 428]
RPQSHVQGQPQDKATVTRNFSLVRVRIPEFGCGILGAGDLDHWLQKEANGNGNGSSCNDGLGNGSDDTMPTPTLAGLSLPPLATALRPTDLA